MGQNSGGGGRHRGGVPPTGPGAGTRRGTALTVLAAVMLIIARFFGPGPGGSLVHLVVVLVLVVGGVGVAIVGVRFAVRAVRAGRDMATGALVIGSFLVLWGVVVLIGTFARYFAWR